MNKILVNVGLLNNPGGVSAVYKTLDLENRGLATHFTIYHKKKEKNLFKKIPRIFSKYYNFYKKIKDFDLIMINPSLTYKSFFRDAGFALLTKYSNKKLVVFWHGWEEGYERKIQNSIFLKFLFLKTFGKADAFVVLGSLFEKKLWALGVNSSKKTLIFHNVAQNKFLINSKFSLKEIIEDANILFISRFEKGKGMFTAIESFIKLRNELKKYHINLIMAGDGNEYRNVVKYLEEKGEKRIILTGFVKDFEKHKLLEKSHIMFFPTTYGEGLPITILEGMLYGMPIVTGRVGGISDIILNEENGFLIETQINNPIDQYTEALKRLITDKDLFHKISLNNIKFANRNLTPDKASKILSGFLSKI